MSPQSDRYSPEFLRESVQLLIGGGSFRVPIDFGEVILCLRYEDRLMTESVTEILVYHLSTLGNILSADTWCRLACSSRCPSLVRESCYSCDL